MNSLLEKEYNLHDIGIVFVGPIVGITPSLIDTFDRIVKKGASVISVDIFGNDYEKKTFWKVIKLTMLPGANSRRISFANSFQENRVFDKIEDAIEKLLKQGKKKVIIGGMSGGFIFVARIIQLPSDNEIQTHNVLKFNKHIVGLFGVSPLIFYPQGVHRLGVNLDLIPPSIQTILFFGDNDVIIPSGTLDYAKVASKIYNHIQIVCLKGEEFKKKPGSIKHQFFGGPDFIGKFKNIFWNPEAEKYVINILIDFLERCC